MRAARKDSLAEPKRVTLAEVAKLAGVSVMTASYAYNRPGRVSEHARCKVMAAAAALEYAGPDPSARALRRGRTGTLGVVLGEGLGYGFEDAGTLSFLAGVLSECAGHGYGMTILPITGARDDLSQFLGAAVDGFVMGPTFDDDPALAMVRAARRPTAVHGGPGAGLKVVGIDNVAAAYAVGALAFAGARRPAILSQPFSRAALSWVARAIPVTEASSSVVRDKLEGYRLAARDAGCAWDEVTVAVCSGNDARKAALLTAELLASPNPPDAIAAMTGPLAAGALQAALEVGLVVPDDLAITGWDDTGAVPGLGLTTVAQSLRDQGAACARVALGHPIGSSPSRWAVVRRSSTRA